MTMQAQDVRHALQTLEEIDFLTYCCAADDVQVNWERVRVAAAQAMGLLVDKGTEASWAAAELLGYTRAGVAEALHSQAVAEGRARGFEHVPAAAPVRFFPVDATAPF
jgi:hypothetical protein